MFYYFIYFTQSGWVSDLGSPGIEMTLAGDQARVNFESRFQVCVNIEQAPGVL